jgi:pimeloyl-ACP methyl ester carboxylesterase
LPKTRFALDGDTHIAYQVAGNGPVDVVLIPDWESHTEAQWELPPLARLLTQMSSFSRLILYDKRGTGLSDPVSLTHLPSLETWVDDIGVVLAAVESERAAILGFGSGGALGMMFAATHPERTSALIVANSFARAERAPDYPAGAPLHVLDRLVDVMGSVHRRGEGEVDWMAPAYSDHAPFREHWARYQRLASTPGTAMAMQRLLNATDIRSVLPTINVPTLVLHRTGDRFIRVGHGRYLAEHIPSARYVELPGEDHLFFLGDTDSLLGEIQEFLTGVRDIAVADRLLATILFTDIVDSTRTAAAVGNRRWQEIIDGHDLLVRRQLGRFRGREVKTLGDGFLAVFDGPARAVLCGCAIRDSARSLGVSVRVGIHTGEVEQRGEDISGLAVNIGARVAGNAGTNEVLVSHAVPPLVVGSGLEFEDRGEHELKGVPGMWRLFAVTA